MILITHQSHLDSLPVSCLKTHLQFLFNELTEETDTPPALMLLDPTDDPRSPDFQFISEECHQDCFEWIHYDENLKAYTALHLEYGEFGTYLAIPESVTLAQPSWLQKLTDQPL